MVGWDVVVLDMPGSGITDGGEAVKDHEVYEMVQGYGSSFMAELNRLASEGWTVASPLLQTGGGQFTVLVGRWKSDE